MTLNLLFDHFDQLITRPEDIPRLNQAILQLALQGKLLPQDATDEPAFELLKRIRAEKDRLLLTGQLSRDTLLPPIDEDEIPYDLPPNWMWVRLPEIYHDWGQKKPNEPFTYIDVSSINNEVGVIGDELQVIAPENAPSRARKLVKRGTVIYSTVRPYLLNVAIVDRDYDPPPIVSTAFAVMHLFGGMCNKFLFYYLRSKPFINFVEAQMTGMAYPAINDTKLNLGLVPLPPLTEQKRIVAKVEILLAQTRVLAAELAAAKQERARLNRASLHHLLAAPTPTDFAARWHFVATHFDGVTADPASVDELKQIILQLTMQGKLVPQDFADEPASELLKRIRTKKDRLVKEGKIRKFDLLPLVGESEIPFQVPQGWEWIRLDDICHQITDGTHHTPTYVSSGVPFLSVKDISQGFIDFSDTRFITREEHEKLIQRCQPEYGDILFTKVGTTGIAKVIDTKREFSIFVSVALLKFSQAEIYSRFLEYLLNSPLVKQQSDQYTMGVGNKNLVLKYIKSFVTPLPPLAEQKRIVAKVEYLFKQCDELKAGLAAGEAARARLLESVLHGTVNGLSGTL